MEGNFEGLVKLIYKKWKKRSGVRDSHLDEETLACFLDGCLSDEEKEGVWLHLTHCDNCAESLALALGDLDTQINEVPEPLLNKLRDIINLREKPSLLEVALRLKENMFEIIKVTGDILLGQELVPAAVLRSRNIRGLKDEVIILKDFKDIRLEVKVENKEGRYFNVTLQAKLKIGAKTIKDLRVTLIKDDLELESYFSQTGSVVFEHILLGKYNLEVTSSGNKLVSVVLDMKA